MDHREQFPTCAHALRFVSCGDGYCPLHGEYERKWAGRGASLERDQDFRRLVLDRMRVQLSEERPSPQPFDGSYPKWSAEEMLLRKLLWLRHGCTGLYGDDGEMQCAKCMIDFLRESPREIERRFFELGTAAVRSVDSLRPPDPWSIPFERHAKDCIVRVHAHVGLRAPLGTYHVWERTVTRADILSPEQTLLDLVNAKPCRCGADSVAAPEETKHE